MISSVLRQRLLRELERVREQQERRAALELEFPGLTVVEDGDSKTVLADLSEIHKRRQARLDEREATDEQDES